MEAETSLPAANPPGRVPPRAVVVAAALLALAGCQGTSGGGSGGAPGGPPPREAGGARGADEGAAAPRTGPRPTADDVADRRDVGIRELTEEDTREFAAAWRLFVTHDLGWEPARDAWLARGGAAPYVLSENLFRYFWSASRCGRKDEVVRVAIEARVVGEPAVAYFAKALVTDRWPLKEPVTTEVFNPDNVGKPLRKTFTHYDIDDTTRQHAARVLAAIGEPAVRVLAAPTVTRSTLRSTRVYGAYALGAIGSASAVESLARTLREDSDWQVRGAAAKALGFALPRNPSARAPLEAALHDPDPFVQKKAREALDGKSRLEF